MAATENTKSRRPVGMQMQYETVLPVSVYRIELDKPRRRKTSSTSKKRSPKVGSKAWYKANFGKIVEAAKGSTQELIGRPAL